MLGDRIKWHFLTVRRLLCDTWSLCDTLQPILCISARCFVPYTLCEARSFSRSNFIADICLLEEGGVEDLKNLNVRPASVVNLRFVSSLRHCRQQMPTHLHSRAFIKRELRGVLCVYMRVPLRCSTLLKQLFLVKMGAFTSMFGALSMLHSVFV